MLSFHVKFLQTDGLTMAKEHAPPPNPSRGEGHKNTLLVQLFTTQSRLPTTLKQRALENIVGKGENAGNQQFLLFIHISFVVYKCFEVGPV